MSIVCDPLLPPPLTRYHTGEFYGPDCSLANLHMLSRFYKKYPEYAEKTFLSVKGGLKPNSLSPDGS